MKLKQEIIKIIFFFCLVGLSTPKEVQVNKEQKISLNVDSNTLIITTNNDPNEITLDIMNIKVYRDKVTLKNTRNDRQERDDKLTIIGYDFKDIYEELTQIAYEFYELKYEEKVKVYICFVEEVTETDGIDQQQPNEICFRNKEILEAGGLTKSGLGGLNSPSLYVACEPESKQVGTHTKSLLKLTEFDF
jgi:hypothetical protein